MLYPYIIYQCFIYQNYYLIDNFTNSILLHDVVCGMKMQMLVCFHPNTEELSTTLLSPLPQCTDWMLC